MGKRITKKEKIAAAEAAAKAAAEGAAASTVTEQTTVETSSVEAEKPAKAKPIEVVGEMEALIEAFGSVEAAIAACDAPDQQKFVELYEFGDEPGAKGVVMKWSEVVVISHDITVVGGTRKVWIMMATPGVVKAYRKSLRGKKFFEQSLPQALEAYKRLQESNEAWLANKAFKAEVKAGQAERVAKFAAMNLLDSRSWIPLTGIGKDELAEIIGRLMPIGVTEKPAFLQGCLDMAAESVGGFLTALEAAIAEKGQPKSFADYRTVYEAVRQSWWDGKKVIPHAHGLKLVTRRFAGETFGVVLYEDDAAVFVGEMDRQFDERQANLKAKIEKDGKTFNPAMRPQVEVKDPVYGFLLFLLFSGPKESAKLAEKKVEAAAKREAEEAARVAENAKAVAGFKVGLGAALELKYGMKVESLADLAGLTTKPTRRPKGDRRHNRDN